MLYCFQTKQASIVSDNYTKNNRNESGKFNEYNYLYFVMR